MQNFLYGTQIHARRVCGLPRLGHWVVTQHSYTEYAYQWIVETSPSFFVLSQSWDFILDLDHRFSRRDGALSECSSQFEL